jgi:hypothetical protein
MEEEERAPSRGALSSRERRSAYWQSSPPPSEGVHTPLEHWLLRSQDVSLGWAAVQAVPLHQKPVAQDASPTMSSLGQVVAHAEPLAQA